MKIAADSSIAGIGTFARLGALTLFPQGAPPQTGRYDALLVSSRTPVTGALAAQLGVQMVCTLTSGLDHLEMPALAHRGVAVRHTRGANAAAVVNYVTCAIALWLRTTGRHLGRQRISLLGHGKVGALLAASPMATQAQECRVFDPWVPEHNTPPDGAFWHADILSLHCALTADTPHPTQHLVGRAQIAGMGGNALCINTARGGVVREDVLAQGAPHPHWVCDVYTHEPNIDWRWVRGALLASPHIAGHSVQARTNGLKMAYRQLADWCGVATPAAAWEAEKQRRPELPVAVARTAARDMEQWGMPVHALLFASGLVQVGQTFQRSTPTAASFVAARRLYVPRHEPQAWRIPTSVPRADRAWLQDWGFGR